MTYRKILIAFVFLAVSALTPSAHARTPVCDTPFPDVFKKASNSVVRVLAVVIDPFRIAGRVQPRIGSGFVVEPGDLVVTNAHVVNGAKILMVQSSDIKMIPATLIGTDPVLDLAVLRVNVAAGPHLPALELGNSSALQVGENVMAIGNPFGIGETATVGVVSALNRVLPISTLSYLTPFIQIDAAINPGNSGGPLLNMCGQVVGVTTAAIKQAQAIGFAVPVNIVKKIVPELIKNGHVSRAWYGIYGRMLDPFFASWLHMPPVQGFLVETVEPGSPAEKIGLRGGTLPVQIATETFLLGGDIITKVDGTEITDIETVRRVINGLTVGQTVHIEYFRPDQGPLSADVTLPERPTLPSDLESGRDAD